MEKMGVEHSPSRIERRPCLRYVYPNANDSPYNTIGSRNIQMNRLSYSDPNLVRYNAPESWDVAIMVVNGSGALHRKNRDTPIISKKDCCNFRENAVQ